MKKLLLIDTMAIKSFILSLLLTIALCYIFMVGIFSKSFILNHVPDWVNILIVIAGGMLYIVAFCWGIIGLHQSKILSFFSLSMSGFGILIYVGIFMMQTGKGEAAEGQFDYDLKKIPLSEREVILSIAKQINIQTRDIQLTDYWKLKDFTMSVCIQKGHVIGIGICDVAIKDVSLFSKLPQLSGLYLQNTNLSSLEGLKSDKLYRLELQNNHFKDLSSFSAVPNVEWLFMERNDLMNLNGMEQMPKLKEMNFNQNPCLSH